MERLEALPLSDEEKGLILAKLFLLPEYERSSFFPTYINNNALAIALRHTFCPAPTPALALVTTPVRSSKKRKMQYIASLCHKVSVEALLGHDFMATLAAIQWLWLHLFGADVPLRTFLSTTHERRYYPYVRAIASAAAANEFHTVEVLSADPDPGCRVPDVQISVNGGARVIPWDVKKTWSYGSVDDPDGVIRNGELLQQLLDYVQSYHKEEFPCLSCLFLQTSHVLFLDFDIDRTGELKSLKFAPGFSRGGTAGPPLSGQVEILDMRAAFVSRFNFLGNVDSLTPEDHLCFDGMSFRKLLPATPPSGFDALVKYFRKLAPECYQSLCFEYESKDGSVEVGEVLASGTKSCVIATKQNSVLKVTSEAYRDQDMKAHYQIDGVGCPYLRRLTNHGVVQGAGPGLVFIELEGLGVPFSGKHVRSMELVQRRWEEASAAVKAMHQQGVYHRDIKPANFIVLDEGKVSERLVLNDLDCSAVIDALDDLTEDVGTPAYKSSRLVGEHKEYQCCDDWMSLGLSFAEMLKLFKPETLKPEGCEAEHKRNVVSRLRNSGCASDEMKVILGAVLAGQDVPGCCRCKQK